MNYVAALKTADLAPGAMTSVTVGEQAILVANVGGAFHAIARKCPHMGADLCQGRLSGSMITCPKHAAGFDVTTGRAVDPAKVLFLKIKTKDAVAFPVKVEGEEVLIGV